MKSKLNNHLLSILFVFSIFLVIFILVQPREKKIPDHLLKFDRYIPPVDSLTSSELPEVLLQESLDLFFPEKADSIKAYLDYKKQIEDDILTASVQTQKLTWKKLDKIISMWFKFMFIYTIVILLTYYSVQTFALFRFVRYKQDRNPPLFRIIRYLQKLSLKENLKNNLRYAAHSLMYLSAQLVKTLGYLILFAPAYVIAYSFKTRFDTDSVSFMIFLGVISNGLLILYSHKFFTFLMTESRKGYVQVAIVKNLNNSYFKQDIPLFSILKLKKKFPGHVLEHIFRNARFQYLYTLKEQAAFLITGLIIIEMALNIQGHLSYELLQNLLYEDYRLVLIILFGIFLVVKATEITVDYLIQRAYDKIANKK